MHPTGIQQRIYGTTPGGQRVDAWTLIGSTGVTLECITFGGIVTRLLVPSGYGRVLDVVLGLDSLANYTAGHPYFGAITGRVAGRITGAQFTLNGVTYKLSANNGPHHLHGGIHALDKTIWNAEPVPRADGAPSLRLTYRSPDGEEGYPGNVDIAVTYTVTHDNAFMIETEVSTDKPTPLSLTHHDYFNLGGPEAPTIEDHTLQVQADDYIGIDADYALTDRTEKVDGHAEDFRQGARVGDRLGALPLRHGGLYALKNNGKLQEVARLHDPSSGLTLVCQTTCSHLQIYTASAFDGSITGKYGKQYPPYAGICLECEGYANGANAPHMGDIILYPGSPQRHTTVYRFAKEIRA